MRQRIAPERACDGEEIYYNEFESVRYTECEQTVRIQRDLTLECLKLLGPFTDSGCIVVNIGCGSGLCGRVLSDRDIPWVGADVSEHMLGLARERPTCCGKIMQLDCFTESALPFRNACFCGAVSVSAVQWICAQHHPEAKALSFMREMYRILREGSFFIAQVYVHTGEHIQVLCRAASRAGLVGGIYTSFPHTSKAKKKFLCLYRPSCDAVLPPEDVPCCISWPAAFPCALPWLEFQKHIGDDHADTVQNPIHIRVCDEHRSLSSRVLRLVQRATACDARDNAHEQVVRVFECTSKHYVPCGGPFNIHIWNQTDRNEGDIVKRLLGAVPMYSSERVKMFWDVPWRDKLKSSARITKQFCRIEILDDHEEYTLACLTADKVCPLYIVACNVTWDDTASTSTFAQLHAAMQKLYTSSVIAIDIICPDVPGAFSIACIYYIPETVRSSIRDVQGLLASTALCNF